MTSNEGPDLRGPDFQNLWGFSLRKNAGQIAQLAKCLPGTHKDLSVCSRTHILKPAVIVYPSNPSIGKGVEMDGSDVHPASPM